MLSHNLLTTLRATFRNLSSMLIILNTALRKTYQKNVQIQTWSTLATSPEVMETFACNSSNYIPRLILAEINSIFTKTVISNCFREILKIVESVKFLTSKIQQL